MVFSKFNRILVFLLLLTSFISLTYAEFPLFEFSETSYDPGEVIITGQASSGTEVNLYVNENFVGKKNVLANSKTIQLNDSIKNEITPIGANLIFRNNNPARVYILNISNTIKTLNYGQTYTFSSYVQGDVLYRDEEEGISKIITISDELTNFSFNDAHNYLQDGRNNLKFVMAYPLNTKADVNEFLYNVEYEKYSNQITLNNFTNITKYKEMEIKGVVTDSNSPLYYLLNIEGDITNTGVLNPIPLNGASFNFTIPRLREGENTLRLITTDSNNPNLFNGETKVKIISDTTPPTIEFINALRRFTNEARLELNISTDAILLNYTFNEKNYSEEVENENILISLNLKDGQNDLTLIAQDLAGNVYKIAHQIELDRENPDILRPYDENLEPEELFFGGRTAHFFFQKIEGKTNKPNVEMTIFTFPEDTDDIDGNRVTCAAYKTFFYRNLGQLDNDRPDGPELNLNESQLSLLSFISKRETLTTDSEGNFDTIITLQERSFDRSDLSDAQNPRTPPRVDNVDSKNRICFIMADKYGNVNVYDEIVTLDAGNTMWRAGEVTTIPNTMYAAEIEQTGDIRSGNGQVEFGVIARFQYIGPGKVTQFSGLGVAMDTRGSQDSRYGSIDTSRFNWLLDKDTGDLIVYFPVEVRKLNLKPIDYPDKLDFAFQINRLNYVLDDNTIPIDEQNPIYFQTSLNIERPLDHAKWLTPETIEELQSFLNQTITFTQTAVDYLGYASIGGVLACTGAKMYFGAQIAFAKAEGDTAKEQDATKSLYMVCDRVVGLPSPQACTGEYGDFAPGDTGIFTVDPNNNRYRAGDSALENANVYSSDTDNPILARFQSLTVGQPCNYSGQGKLDGVIISGDVNRYEKNGNSWISPDTQSRAYIPNKCEPANFKDSNGDVCTPIKDSNGRITNSDCKVNQIDLKGASGACFTNTYPEFDQTKCNFFTADGDEGLPGWNPKDNILESIRCGVITDTYSHAKNLLKIQQQIYMCLEQAKIGEVKGSYCERLLSQAVCDVATNVIFKTLSQSTTSTQSGPSTRDDNFLITAFAGAREGDRLLNDRYQGSFLTQTGLGTDQIVNKVCLGALTGDWSVLTNNILSAVDQNEVKPSFGPMYPTSRIQGYNPLTGDLSIQYRFTYGVVSGGQRINSKVEFFCDKSQPGGEYCPEGRISSDKTNSAIRTLRLYTPDGGVKQESKVVTDPQARFRYNEVCLTHEYSLDNVQQTTEPICENVFHNGDLFAQCYWDAGLFGTSTANPSNIGGTQVAPVGGLKCDALFSDQSLISLYTIDDKTKLAPSNLNGRAVYYPGNDIFVDLYYDVRNSEVQGSQNNFNLYYKATCNGNSNPAFGFKSISIEGENAFGHQLVNLLEVPEIGTTRNYITEYYKTSLSLPTNLEGLSLKVSANTGFTNIPQSIEIYDILHDGESLTQESIRFDLDSEGKFTTESNTKLQNLFQNKGPGAIELRFASEVKNIIISLVSNEKTSGNIFPVVVKQTGDLVNEKLENIQSGTCNLELRLVPSSITLNSQNFANLSSFGDNIATNVRNSEIFKTSFSVNKNTDSNHQFNFEIVSPYDNEGICIYDDKDSLELNLEVVGISSDKASDLLKVNEIFAKNKVTINFDKFQKSIELNDLIMDNKMFISKSSLKTTDFPNFDKTTTATIRVIYEDTNLENPIVKSKQIIFNKCNVLKENIFG